MFQASKVMYLPESSGEADRQGTRALQCNIGLVVSSVPMSVMLP